MFQIFSVKPSHEPIEPITITSLEKPGGRKLVKWKWGHILDNSRRPAAHLKSDLFLNWLPKPRSKCRSHCLNFQHMPKCPLQCFPLYNQNSHKSLRNVYLRKKLLFIMLTCLKLEPKYIGLKCSSSQSVWSNLSKKKNPTIDHRLFG